MTIHWKNDKIRAALLNLWTEQTLQRNATRAPLIDHLLEAGILAKGSRAREYRLPEHQRAAYATLLQRIWPQWRTTLDELHHRGLTATPANLLVLRRKPLEDLPPRLHHKTYAALVGAHSKSGIEPPENTTLTQDDLLRLRTPAGFTLRDANGAELPCDPMMQTLGEIVLPERALLDGITPAGALPRCLFTIENLGAYIDLPHPSDLLLIHQPGWNSRLAQQLIRTLPPDIPWFHFGDLDPEGIRIYQSLGDATRKPELWIPEFWGEYLNDYALPVKQPWPVLPEGLVEHPLLHALLETGRWLEQEVAVVDSRISEALDSAWKDRAAWTTKDGRA